MRFKPVPEPPADLAFVAEAQRALPLVPGSEDDCCARLVSRTDLPARDEARRWLTFLRALGLAEETHSGGFVRVRRDPDPDALAAAFHERVFGAREVLSILDAADRPLAPDAVFERFAAHVPKWERDRMPGEWRDLWGERVARLLGWAALFGLAEVVDGGYRRTDARV